jgi:hypothetical protein
MPLGAEAALVGTVEAEPAGLVVMDTQLAAAGSWKCSSATRSRASAERATPRTSR